jgi:hypothetical protein
LEPPSFLEAGRALLISTLPTAPSKPRAPEPSSTSKPGTRLTMSSAVLGRWAAKKSGVKTRTPRWVASARGAWPAGPVGTGAWATWGSSPAKADAADRNRAVLASSKVFVIGLPLECCRGMCRQRTFISSYKAERWIKSPPSLQTFHYETERRANTVKS